jgi:diguanylate cyclase (GGDEF)-like protein
MSDRLNLYIPLVYMSTAVVYAGLGVYAWQKRSAAAVASFGWAMLGLFIWTFAYSLEIISPSLAGKLFFVGIEYIGLVIAPVFMLFFAFAFGGKSHLLTFRVRAFLLLLPITALILAWTNPYHHLMWEVMGTKVAHGLILLDVRYADLFWIHIIYSYILMILACILLALELIQRPSIYRAQIGFLILSILAPLIGGGIYLSGNSPVVNLDITPLFFLPTALGLSWAVFKYRLLEVLPPEYFTVLKNLKDGVIVLNPQQRILYINPIAEGLLNHDENKAIGQPLSQISGMYAETLAPYLTGGEHRAEIKVREGNQIKVFDMSASPTLSLSHSKERGNSNSIVILHDITQRKEAEAALSRRESIMAAISLAAEQFLRETTWEHYIPGVLERIGQSADVSRVYVAMNYMDGDNNVFSSLCYEWAASNVSSQLNNPMLRHVPMRKAGFGRWRDALSQGNPIFGLVRDMPQDEQKFLRTLGSLSLAAMPIFVDDQWWGFIVFDECRNEREWTGMELEAFHAAANIFGAAETRARTEQRSMRRQRTLNLLHEIVGISLKANDIKELSQMIVDRLGELINAEECFMTLWDEENKLTLPLAAYGPQKDTYTSLSTQPGERTYTLSALQHGHTLVIDNTSTTTYAEKRIIESFPSKSVLVLPLIASKKRLGAIIFAFNTTHRFQADEISVCEQASALIALALEKYQILEDARRRAHVSEALRKASITIAEKLELEQTVSRILEQLNGVIPYDSASVQLLDGNELEIIGGSGFADMESVLGLRFPIPGDNPNTIVIETGRPYIIPEIDEKYHVFNDISSIHIRSWLGVPLIYRDHIIGLLTIDSTQSNHFKEEHVTLATEFANQVAIALENARIFEEVQSQAITDPLTGIYNRRGLFQLGEFEFQRARRIGRPFCAVIFDIDHFKRVNDHYGHAVGDQVLNRLVERCRKNAHVIDLLIRYGGEEFVILLPETNLESAKHFAERLRQAVMKDPFETSVGPLRMTVSIGVAEMNEQDTLQTLIERADTALYKAKSVGRNCVVVDDSI